MQTVIGALFEEGRETYRPTCFIDWGHFLTRLHLSNGALNEISFSMIGASMRGNVNKVNFN